VLWLLYKLQSRFLQNSPATNATTKQFNIDTSEGATNEEELTIETGNNITSGTKICYKQVVTVSYLDLMMITQVQAWVDATENEGLDEIRITPTTTTVIDQRMICDIQHSISSTCWESTTVNWYINL